MPKFNLVWKEIVYYEAQIDADSEEEARKKFSKGQVHSYKEVDTEFLDVTHVEEVQS